MQALAVKPKPAAALKEEKYEIDDTEVEEEHVVSKKRKVSHDVDAYRMETEDGIAFEIFKNKDRRVHVKKFRNMKLIDLREWYSKDGKKMPGSKGISLTEEQWKKIIELEHDITECIKLVEADSDRVEDLELNSSNTRRIRVRSFKGRLLIDFREFYSKDGEMKPGKKGISLNLDQFFTLMAHKDEITDCVDEL